MEQQQAVGDDAAETVSFDWRRYIRGALNILVHGGTKLSRNEAMAEIRTAAEHEGWLPEFDKHSKGLEPSPPEDPEAYRRAIPRGDCRVAEDLPLPRGAGQMTESEGDDL